MYAFRRRIDKILVSIICLTLPHISYANEYQTEAEKVVKAYDLMAKSLADQQFNQIFQESFQNVFENFNELKSRSVIDVLLEHNKGFEKKIRHLRTYHSLEDLRANNTYEDVYGLNMKLNKAMNDIIAGYSNAESLQSTINDTDARIKNFISDFINNFNNMCRDGLSQGIENGRKLDFKLPKVDFSLAVNIPLRYPGEGGVPTMPSDLPGAASEGEEGLEYALMTVGSLGSFILGAKIATGAWIVTTTGSSVAFSTAAISSSGALMASLAWAGAIAAVIAIAVLVISHQRAIKESRKMVGAQRYLFDKKANSQTVANYFKKRCAAVSDSLNSLTTELNGYHDNPEKFKKLVDSQLSSKIKPYNELMELFYLAQATAGPLRLEMIKKGVSDEKKIREEILKTKESTAFFDYADNFKGENYADMIYWILAKSFIIANENKERANKEYQRIVGGINLRAVRKAQKRVRSVLLGLEKAKPSRGSDDLVVIEMIKDYQGHLIRYCELIVKSLVENTSKDFNLLRNQLHTLNTKINSSVVSAGLNAEYEGLQERIKDLIGKVERAR